MILTINIPEKDIPKMQSIMNISLHFLDGQLVEYTAPSGWDIEEQEPEDKIDLLTKRVEALEKQMKKINDKEYLRSHRIKR